MSIRARTVSADEAPGAARTRRYGCMRETGRSSVEVVRNGVICVDLRTMMCCGLAPISLDRHPT